MKTIQPEQNIASAQYHNAYVCMLLFFAMVCFVDVSYANPQGGQIVAGQVTINHNNNSYTQVNQLSNKAIINWQSFNIENGEHTHFNQPNANAVILNRVLGVNPSAIFGNLTANGQVVLVNPAGIIFGPNSSVDVAGLIATTSDISQQNFLSGNYVFQNGQSSKGAIINYGQIRVSDHGLVALVAPGVENHGVIEANLGKVVLAAGNAFTVDIYGDNLIEFTIGSELTSAAVNNNKILKNGVLNNGIITANGGKVLLTANAASGVLDNVISMNGVIEANTVLQQKGEVILQGGESGVVRVAGTISTKGDNAGEVGGVIKLLGEKVGLTGNSLIDASGWNGGGEILIGGNYQGKGPENNAYATYVGSKVNINADANVQGDGGRVIVWADNANRYYGSISAKGGINGGNGGFVEVSGKKYLDFKGFADVSAATDYQKGTILLDPDFLSIEDVGANDGLLSGNIIFFAEGPAVATISDEALEALVGAIFLLVNIDLTVNQQVDFVNNNNLIVVAGRSIIFNETLTGLNSLYLQADFTNNGDGRIIFSIPSLSANTINLNDLSDFIVASTANTVIEFNGLGDQELISTVGSLRIFGNVIKSSPSDLSLIGSENFLVGKNIGIILLGGVTNVVAGDLNIGGTPGNQNMAIIGNITASGSINFANDFYYASATTVNAVNGNLIFNGELTNIGVLPMDVILSAGTNLIFRDNVTVANGDLTLNGDVFYENTLTINAINGALTINGNVASNSLPPIDLTLDADATIDLNGGIKSNGKLTLMESFTVSGNITAVDEITLFKVGIFDGVGTQSLESTASKVTVFSTMVGDAIRKTTTGDLRISGALLANAVVMNANIIVDDGSLIIGGDMIFTRDLIQASQNVTFNGSLRMNNFIDGTTTLDAQNGTLIINQYIQDSFLELTLQAGNMIVINNGIDLTGFANSKLIINSISQVKGDLLADSDIDINADITLNELGDQFINSVNGTLSISNNINKPTFGNLILGPGFAIDFDGVGNQSINILNQLFILTSLVKSTSGDLSFDTTVNDDITINEDISVSDGSFIATARIFSSDNVLIDVMNGDILISTQEILSVENLRASGGTIDLKAGLGGNSFASFLLIDNSGTLLADIIKLQSSDGVGGANTGSIAFGTNVFISVTSLFSFIQDADILDVNLLDATGFVNTLNLLPYTLQSVDGSINLTALASTKLDTSVLNLQAGNNITFNGSNLSLISLIADANQLNVGGEIQIQQTTNIATTAGGIHLQGPVVFTGANQQLSIVGGNLTVDDTVNKNSGQLLVQASGDVSFNGTVNGAFDLIVNGVNGLVEFGSDVGTISRLNSIALAANNIILHDVHTTGNQNYTSIGLTQLNSNYSTLGGAYIISGTTHVMDTTNITSNGGPIVLEAINLFDHLSLHADFADIQIGPTNGGFDLTLNSSNTTTLLGLHGSVSPLASITTNAGGTTTINDDITISGKKMVFNDNVIIGTDVILTDLGNFGIEFMGTVTDPTNSGLLLNAGSGNIIFDQWSSIASLTIGSAGNVTVNNGLNVGSFLQLLGFGTTDFGTIGLVSTGAVNVNTGNIRGTLKGNNIILVTSGNIIAMIFAQSLQVAGTAGVMLGSIAGDATPGAASQVGLLFGNNQQNFTFNGCLIGGTCIELLDVRQHEAYQKDNLVNGVSTKEVAASCDDSDDEMNGQACAPNIVLPE